MSLKLNPGKGEPPPANRTPTRGVSGVSIFKVSASGLYRRSFKKFPVPGPLYLVSLLRFLLLSFYLT
jgi:hypothetical protein